MAGVAAENGGGERSAADRREAAERLIESHDAVFRRTARRYSICGDDAEDAYQRSLEILLTKAPPIEGDALVRWMQTVTKREALAVRRQRERLLSSPRPAGEDEHRDPLDSIASERAGPSDRAASRERVARSGEALRALKPQEVRALTLKAQGYSYSEIGEITGWTYTKINRCMAEGRKRFLEVYADLEQGRRCEELAGALSALADGEPAVDGADDVERHLRACGPCRAKLRAFRAIPDRVLELMPAGPAIEQSAAGGAHEWIGDRLAGAAEKLREASYALVSRGAGAGEGAAPLAAGGTRGAGVAALGKLLAVCGATAAGGAACVATGVVDNEAIGLGQTTERPALDRPAERPPETPIDHQEPVPEAPAVAEAPPPEPPAEEPAPEPTPAEQAETQFGIEGPAQASGGGGASSGGEFGGPAGGGGSSGGSGGGAAGGFGFEKG